MDAKAEREHTRREPEARLVWLLRLRWVAVAGQSATCALVHLSLHLDLRWGLLGGLIAITAITNAVAHLAPGWLPRTTTRAIAALLLQDTLVLAAMIWWSGGAGNPFVAFFLLHLAIGSTLLPLPWLRVLLATADIAYLLQFLSPHRIPGVEGPGGSGLASVGGAIAFLMVGASITFFVGRLANDLRARENELAKARERSARNERFASLATLAAGVAHELATPLSTIAVVSSDFEKLAGGGCHNAECLNDAKLIRAEVERCRAVLESLGERSNRDLDAPFDAIPLSALPELLAPYLKPVHRPRIEYSFAQGVPQVVAPGPALFQSLAALAKNACEAAPNGIVVLAIESVSGGIRFSVTDSGCGMPADFLSRAGEPFLTTKPPGKGMGLGLFLVRTFAERMGGTLELKSTPGEGTRAELWIPVATEIRP